MTLYRWIIMALWLVLVVYWAAAAPSAKHNVATGLFSRETALRLLIVLLILLALNIPVLNHALRDAQAFAAGNMLIGSAGAVFCALGIGLALLARAHLGRNWGMPMARKTNPELVTAGPYALVRHPIYSGMLLAMLGSAMGEDVLWVLPLVLFGLYFVYSARREEHWMIEQFPEQYPAYMTRTKMLLPFVC